MSLLLLVPGSSGSPSGIGNSISSVAVMVVVQTVVVAVLVVMVES